MHKKFVLSLLGLAVVGLTGCQTTTAKLESPTTPVYTQETLDLQGVLGGQIGRQLSANTDPELLRTGEKQAGHADAIEREYRAWVRNNRS